MLSSLLAKVSRAICGVGLVLLAQEAYGSFGVAGAMAGAFAIGLTVGAPVFGGLIDRYGQTTTLMATAVANAALLVLLALTCRASTPAAVSVALAGLAGLTAPPIAACARTLWSSSARDARSRDAMLALDASSQELSWVAGSLLVGVFVAGSDVRGALLFAATASIIGISVFATSHVSRAWRAEGVRRSRMGAVASGPMRAIYLSVFFSGSGWGALTVGLPALAVHLGVPALSGVLFAGVSVGALIGGLGYGAREWGSRLGPRYEASLVVIAVCSMPVAFADTTLVAVALSVLAGLGWAGMLAIVNALIGHHAPPGTLTEAFTWSNAAAGGGQAAGAVIAGVAVHVSSLGPFVLVAATALFAAAVTRFAARG